MRVTWDPEKSAINQRHHGLTFEVAAQVFQDHHRIEDYDLDHSDVEDRWTVLGLVGSVGYVIRVTCTDQEPDVVRIISARRADRHQVQTYLRLRGDHA